VHDRRGHDPHGLLQYFAARKIPRYVFSRTGYATVNAHGTAAVAFDRLACTVRPDRSAPCPRSVMFMGLATPCVAFNHHSMVAQPFLVNVSCPAHYQHNLEPRPRLRLIGQTTSSRLTITELSVAFHSVLVIV